MPNWKKVLTSGSDASLNTLTVTNGITGSLLGTASYASQALSASFATTASYVTLAQTASYVTLAQTSSFTTTAQTASFVILAQTASFITTAQTASRVTSSGVFGPNGANSILTSSFATTASFVTLAQTASFVTLAQTASFVTLAQTASLALRASGSLTGSLLGTAATASFVTTAQTASFVTTAQTASYVLQAVSASFATTSTTQTAGNSTTAVATTAFVTTADNLKANLATPTFTTNITTPLIIGGTAVGSTLTYKTTTGVGTTDAHIFQVGNNGATESMRITNSGNVGIGTTTPDYGTAGTNFTTLSILGKGTTQFSGGILELATQGTDANNNSVGAINFIATANTATKQITSQVGGYTSGTTANNRGGVLTFSTKPDATTSLVERIRITNSGSVGIGTETPTAVLHLKAGSATANTSPLKFTSGATMSIAEAGSVEFLTDAYYGTITTGAARKTFAFLESPTLTTPVLGVATATSVNKVTITAPATAATLTIANNKTVTVNNTLTLAGTDSTTMTFPATSATIARTDAANTFTGVQTMAGITSTGAAVSINTSSNFSTSINAGTSTGTVTIGGGGAMTIAIGAGGIGAKTITIGDGASTGTTTIESGTGALNIGVSNAARTISIGTSTAATAQTVNINNTATAGIVNVGTGITTGTISIGGTAQTGAITLGSSSGTNIVNLGTGAGATTVNIATGVTNAKVINIGTGAISNTIAIGNLTTPSDVTINGGVALGEQFTCLNASYTLTSQTAAQKMFNASTNGAITLPIGTYFFECLFTISGMSATSGTFGFALAGTATKTFISYAFAQKNNGVAGTTYHSISDNVANTALTANTTSTAGGASLSGTIRVTVAGTLIPQISLSTAAAAIIFTNSYFKIRQMSDSSTASSVGNWS